jgi:hypothetical protein
MSAQTTSIKVEDVIAKDSLKTVLVNCIIEGCEKSKVNLRINHQSCPVYLDPEGFIFYIKLEDGDIKIVEL